MASTPDAIFSSIDGQRASVSKPVSLPSPQLSDDLDNDDARGRATSRKIHKHTEEDADADNIAIDCAYQTIWKSFCGEHIAEPFPTFHLRNQTSYERLHQRLEHPGLLRHFEGIRKDWDADTGDLTLRLMASAIHDVTKIGLDFKIEAALARITRDHDLPYQILPGSHATIQKRHSYSHIPYFEKSPDGSFYYHPAGVATSTYRYPPFVFEIAYSQEGRDVQEVAKSFLRNMPAKICTVLAIEIQYLDRAERRREKCHTASFTLRTTERDEEMGTIVVDCLTRQFRDEQGHALPGELALPLKSFLPLEERDGCPDEVVSLSFAFLSELIDKAERQQRLNDATPTPEPERITKIKWRDEDGDVTEQKLPRSTRQRREPAGAALATRTRSSSQPRRSGRLRSSSRGSRAVGPGGGRGGGRGGSRT